ncbi:hypothetical protein [Rufibacter quisquiliarum]|uniref:Uncharacterized protein n=1 Tax=Rufibacter quisquiliarum TaxID=1549639 RepID=A0A839GMC7_9BACT|nr:hypothetical protein [Rufibacter quisquiliarum]MBA9079880.1 hypothetical protein [Rufibacter quisquiliarum]
MMNKALLKVLPVLILVALSMGIWKSCRYDWNPHYFNNNAVQLDSLLYSPDSSKAVVYYTLDVGARGLRQYQTLLRKADFEDELTRFSLPPELIIQKWRSNDTLEVIYDQYEGYSKGGQITDLPLEKDTLTRNGATILIQERRMNKKQRIEQDMKYYSN